MYIFVINARKTVSAIIPKRLTEIVMHDNFVCCGI